MEMGQQARLELAAVSLAVEGEWRGSKGVTFAGELINLKTKGARRQKGESWMTPSVALEMLMGDDSKGQRIIYKGRNTLNRWRREGRAN